MEGLHNTSVLFESSAVWLTQYNVQEKKTEHPVYSNALYLSIYRPSAEQYTSCTEMLVSDYILTQLYVPG